MQTPEICLMAKLGVLETTSYVSPLKTVDAAVLTSSTSLRELPLCDDGSPSILVKATDFDESYGNSIVLTVL